MQSEHEESVCGVTRSLKNAILIICRLTWSGVENRLDGGLDVRTGIDKSDRALGAATKMFYQQLIKMERDIRVTHF